MSRIRILGKVEPAAVIIAAIVPVLWLLDAAVNARANNSSFTGELLAPETSELFLRLWLGFFILAQAWFFHMYSRAKERASSAEDKFKTLLAVSRDCLGVVDIEGRIREISLSGQKLLGYTAAELSTMALFQLCASDDSEKMNNFFREIIGKGFAGLDGVVLSTKGEKPVVVDLSAKLIEDPEEKCVLLCISEKKAQAVPAVAIQQQPVLSAQPVQPAIDLEEERRKIEVSVRQQEQQKAREEAETLKKRYEEIMKRGLEERASLLENKHAEELERKIKAERSMIEEEVRKAEADKHRLEMSALEDRYTKILNSRLADERRQAEEMIRAEEKKNTEEQLRALEARLNSEAAAKISEGRRLIEESVRVEERKKYEELLKNAIGEGTGSSPETGFLKK